MTRAAAAEQLKTGSAGWASQWRQTSDKRLWIDVAPESVVAAAETMVRLDARLQTASGVDGPRKIEILYHWALDRVGLVATVRTRIDRERPEIDSITAACPSAQWVEREMWELLGIHFRGHGDLRHLLLEDDWPDGQYPLRRDYQRGD